MSDIDDHIEKSLHVQAPIDRVWRAISDHEQFGTWFRVALDGPFVPGEIQTGRITYPGYEHLEWRIAVEALEAPQRLAFRWSPYSDTPEPDGPTTLVEFMLEESEGGTRVTIIESGFAALPDDDRRIAAFRLNEQGWEEQRRNLAAHVGA